ncbi:MAG TPA: HAD family hydrolase [Terriglobales bacterium]|nr:HAD family hydrolase [Terriglobales bacterium]
MPSFTCRAILFDLDGVLVDSTPVVARHWRLWAEENGLDPDKLMQVAHGVRTIEVVRALLPHVDAEAEVKKIEMREAADTDGVHVMPGAASLLAGIPQGRWCVVTSGTRYLATSRLNAAGLPIPPALVSADDVTQGKPHPEPYLRGAQLLGFDPANCVVIEDAPAGIRAAHAGGMKAIALTSTFGPEELSEADAIIPGLRDLCLSVISSQGDLQLSIEDGGHPDGTSG